MTTLENFCEGFANVMVYECDEVSSSFQDFTKFVDYEAWWFIDKTGKYISSAYEEVESFSEGFAAVCNGGK